MYYFISWSILLLVYLFTFIIVANVVNVISFVSHSIFIGLFLITIPYMVLGLFSQRYSEISKKRLYLTCIIPAFTEKIIILSIGFFTILNKVHGRVSFEEILDFIQNKFAPFFTIPYLILGPFLSTIICIIFSRLSFQKKEKRR